MTTFVFTALSFLVPGLIVLSEIPIKTDTLKIVSSGANNQAIIDSIHIRSANLTIDTISISGQVKQNGTSNRVEIFPVPVNTSKNKNNNNQHIHITQTGKNNKVKIYSK
jgi:predicted NUDIX family NTP pyrophosphohydrolase